MWPHCLEWQNVTRQNSNNILPPHQNSPALAVSPFPPFSSFLFGNFSLFLLYSHRYDNRAHSIDNQRPAGWRGFWLSIEWFRNGKQEFKQASWQRYYWILTRYHRARVTPDNNYCCCWLNSYQWSPDITRTCRLRWCLAQIQKCYLPRRYIEIICRFHIYMSSFPLEIRALEILYEEEIGIRLNPENT